jgi:hypothetical protein
VRAIEPLTLGVLPAIAELEQDEQGGHHGRQDGEGDHR